MDDHSRQLVEDASLGDGVAVDQLLELHLPGLRAFVRLRSGPLIRAREGSDDIAQSACREVLQHIDRFQYGNEAGFKHWLYTTALRKIQNKHDYWKAEKRDAARDIAPRAMNSAGNNEGLLGAYRSLSSPSQNLIAIEELEGIENAFDSLEEEDREVIILSRLVGMSHKEIGEKTGRNEGATRTHLHRALIRLAEAMATQKS